MNCAGVGQSTFLAKMSQPDIDRLLAANLHGAIYGCKQVGRQMILRKRPGCIINVSSLLAQKGTTGAAVYAAAKAGLVGMLARFSLRVAPVLTINQA